MHLITGPHLRVSDAVGMGWGPRIGIYNKFPGYTGDASTGILFEKCYLELEFEWATYVKHRGASDLVLNIVGNLPVSVLALVR